MAPFAHKFWQHCVALEFYEKIIVHINGSSFLFSFRISYMIITHSIYFLTWMVKIEVGKFFLCPLLCKLWLSSFKTVLFLLRSSNIYRNRLASKPINGTIKPNLEMLNAHLYPKTVKMRVLDFLFISFWTHYYQSKTELYDICVVKT